MNHQQGSKTIGDMMSHWESHEGALSSGRRDQGHRQDGDDMEDAEGSANNHGLMQGAQA